MSVSFQKNGYEVVRNVLSKDLLENLKINFQMVRDLEFFYSGQPNKFAYGDHQTEKSFCIYAARFFESLGIQLTDKVSEIVDVELVPTYTYARIYYEGAELNPHKDGERCEYSTTLCLDTTDPWDFYIKDRNGEDKVVKLNPGDMCVYAGYELEHWRDMYQGEMQMQCFLHYVNPMGKYAELKYDGRPMMGVGTKICTVLLDEGQS